MCETDSVFEALHKGCYLYHDPIFLRFRISVVWTDKPFLAGWIKPQEVVEADVKMKGQREGLLLSSFYSTVFDPQQRIKATPVSDVARKPSGGDRSPLCVPCRPLSLPAPAPPRAPRCRTERGRFLTVSPLSCHQWPEPSG